MAADERALVVTVTIEEQPEPAVPSDQRKCVRCDADLWVSKGMIREMKMRSTNEDFAFIGCAVKLVEG